MLSVLTVVCVMLLMSIAAVSAGAGAGVFAEAAGAFPEIMLSHVPAEGEYVSYVTVTINWNGVEKYKYGIIINDSPEVVRDYTEPFRLTDEGTVRIYAYYYDADRNIVSVSRTVDFIDSTAPYFTGDVSCTVDFSEGKSAWIQISARDDLSGIAKMYVGAPSGEQQLMTLVDGANATYAAECSVYGDAVTVTAEDRAGNKTSFDYDLRYLDRAKIAEYAALYAQADPVRFTTEGWAEFQSAFEALEDALMRGKTQSGEILAAEQRVMLASGRGVKAVVRYAEINADLPTGLSVPNVDLSLTDALIGSDFIIEVASAKAAAEEISSNESAAALLSGYKNPVVSSFSISFTSASRNVTLGEPLTVTVNMPSMSSVAKIYVYSSGALRQISSSINSGRITFTVSGSGDYYLVGDDERQIGESEKGVTIGDKFFPASMLWTAGGIVVGVAALSGVGAFLILYFKNKKK